MANGDNILAGVKFGFHNERYYPHTEGWVECIHWRIGLNHAGRLLYTTTFLHDRALMLSLFEIPNNRDYRKDPRAAVQRLSKKDQYSFDELDPLAIVSIVEEWSKKEPLKVVEHLEAAMLSLPS